MILTSARVICLNDKNSAFKAFDLPLSLISNESFEQPIFGANYLYGTCKPLLNSLPGDITFKIWLMNGGCGTLAPAYLKMIKSCKRNRGRGAEKSVINSYQGGGKKAYIDPNDPSVIYLQQPDVAQNLNYNPFGYQPIPQGPPMQVGPQQINQNPNNNYNNNMNYQAAPMPNVPNNNYPNYQMNGNQINNNQPPMNNINNIPPNNGNNINNNYPNFNQQGEMDLPSSEEVYSQSVNNNQYPEHGIGGLNGVINNQPQQGGKYFGFWGPSLDRNPNHPNNNGP